MPSNPEKYSVYPDFPEKRDLSLSWINTIGNDMEVDHLVLSKENGQLWQQILGEHLVDMTLDQREQALSEWKTWFKPKIDVDAEVIKKNLLLAKLADEVELELSANGIYLRELLSGLCDLASRSDNPEVTMRAQFMGIWVANSLIDD